MWTTTEGPQSETARKRREQIMDAAESIIAHHGIARLSLQRIEKLAGMSRGQLMYYFPSKEAILLAVYERMIRRMIQERLAAEDLPHPMTGQAWQCLHRALEDHLGLGREPLENKQELYSLLYTFLAQIAHREDYRQRLSVMYRSWREHIAADIASSIPPPHPVDPVILASIIQALIHGLTMQLMIDPEAFPRGAMLEACLQMLAPWYGRSVDPSVVNVPSPSSRSEEKS
jgi:AcrR family transcriptional regulator